MKSTCTTGTAALPGRDRIDLEALLGDRDAQLVIKALYDLRETKVEALGIVQAAGLFAGTRGFEPEDFGIPQIDRLLARFDAAPPPDESAVGQER